MSQDLVKKNNATKLTICCAALSVSSVIFTGMSIFLAIAATYDSDKFQDFFKKLLLTDPNDKLCVFSSLCLLAALCASVAALLIIKKRSNLGLLLPIAITIAIFIIGISAAILTFKLISKIDIPTTSNSTNMAVIGLISFGGIALAATIIVFFSIAAKMVYQKFKNSNKIIGDQEESSSTSACKDERFSTQSIDTQSTDSESDTDKEARSTDSENDTDKEARVLAARSLFRFVQKCEYNNTDSEKEIEKYSTLEDFESVISQCNLNRFPILRNKFSEILNEIFSDKISCATRVLETLGKLEPKINRWKAEWPLLLKNKSSYTCNCYKMLKELNDRIKKDENPDQDNINIQNLILEVKSTQISMIKIVAKKRFYHEINLAVDTPDFEQELRNTLGILLSKLLGHGEKEIQEYLSRNIRYLSNINKELTNKELDSPITLKELYSEIIEVKTLLSSCEEIFYSNARNVRDDSDVINAGDSEFGKYLHQDVAKECLLGSNMYIESARKLLSPIIPETVSKFFCTIFDVAKLEVTFTDEDIAIATMQKFDTLTKKIPLLRISLIRNNLLTIVEPLLYGYSTEKEISHAKNLLKALEDLKSEKNEQLKNCIDFCNKIPSSCAMRINVVIIQIIDAMSPKQELKPSLSDLQSNARALKISLFLLVKNQYLDKEFNGLLFFSADFDNELNKITKNLSSKNSGNKAKITQLLVKCFEKLSKIEKISSSTHLDIQSICNEISLISEHIRVHDEIYNLNQGSSYPGGERLIDAGSEQKFKHLEFGVEFLEIVKEHTKKALKLASQKSNTLPGSTLFSSILGALPKFSIKSGK